VNAETFGCIRLINRTGGHQTVSSEAEHVNGSLDKCKKVMNNKSDPLILEND